MSTLFRKIGDPIIWPVSAPAEKRVGHYYYYPPIIMCNYPLYYNCILKKKTTGS